MLSVYTGGHHGISREADVASAISQHRAVWIDLLEPTSEDETLVENGLGIDVPTREEMREIEPSSRFYDENGALYMTATLVTRLDEDLPEAAQVTFILGNGFLVTNRYVDPLPFRRFAAQLERGASGINTSGSVFAALMEAIVNRIADVIERAASDLDGISKEIFAASDGRRVRPDYEDVLARVGQSGELISKARESLGSLGRLLVFAQQNSLVPLPQDVLSRLRVVSRDVSQMADHAGFLGNKLAFILDATLGMINFDQNNILKIFSVATVVLLPPSVIGAIFGMNFAHLPWSQTHWGFGMTLGIMAVSAILPVIYFKRRGWL
ncbi:MAG: magnesium transporter CorA family protein [Steroidobacteraceae bacterium]